MGGGDCLTPTERGGGGGQSFSHAEGGGGGLQKVLG